VLDKWIVETEIKRQYGERKLVEFMFGDMGKECNPVLGCPQEKYPNFEGSLIYLKSESSYNDRSKFSVCTATF